MVDVEIRSQVDLETEVTRLRARVAELEGHLKEERRRANRGQEVHDRLFRRRLTALVEITNELSTCGDQDALCCRAVELGRSRLGFDCLGIWFRTEDPEVIAGSYGVNDEGVVVDERGKRTRIDAHSPERRVHLSGEPFVLQRNVPIRDEAGHLKGHGSQVFAAIWDGEQVIGHISMDNRVSGNPLTEHQCELLRLYGSAIGYLYARKLVESQREDLIVDLRGALDRIKVLSGLVPICSGCKKIRNDQGYWTQLEEFIQEHSDAEFSHGLCPSCARALYPELYPSDESLPSE